MVYFEVLKKMIYCYSTLLLQPPKDSGVSSQFTAAPRPREASHIWILMIGSQRCNEAATYAARLATIGSFWENPSIYFLLQQHQDCLAVAGSPWWAGAAGAPLSTRSGAGWVAPARPVLELRHQNCPIQRGPTSKTASLDDRSSIPSSPSKRPQAPTSPCHMVSQGEH